MSLPDRIVATKLRIPNIPSMPIDRLDARLDDVWRHRLALIVAPAGSGKTTLAARLAHRAPGPVGWYRAEGWDRSEQAMLRHIEAALGPALKDMARHWETVEDAAIALEAWSAEPCLIIIDDLHTLQGTEAEAALERLVDYAPPTVRFVIATRVPPDFNLPRMQVSGELLELTGDDLRLRSWEVERLFADYYQEPLPPEELARLARRTEGWAAGLQLFHLATRGRTPDERRLLLSELSRTSRLVRDYLTRNVLHQLPDVLRSFLVETSVLGRLSGPLCDRLLARTGSAEILADLERRGLFTQALPEDGEYRYHEVLRSYLQSGLLELVGEEGMRARFGAAGALLEDAGKLPEALEAYCRGEDWAGVRRLAAGQGADTDDRASAWVHALPPAMILNDPWLLLASARRLRAEGRFEEAIERYQKAESQFGSADPAAICREERLSLAAWVDGAPGTRSDALSILRNATRRDPSAAAASFLGQPDPTSGLLSGLGELLAGNAAAARRDLLHVIDGPESSHVTQVVAALGAGIAGLLMGQDHARVEIEGAVAAAEVAGLDWVARLGRASLAISGRPEAVREAIGVAEVCGKIGDRWGQTLAALCAAWGGLAAGGDIGHDRPRLADIRALDAPVLEAWRRGVFALAAVRGGEAEAREEALAAEAMSRSLGVNGGRLLAYLALAEASPGTRDADEYLGEAFAIAAETGIRPPLSEAEAADGDGIADLSAPPLVIRVLGAFELRLAGRAVDMATLRPRVRVLLRMLCVNAGSGVHHETLESILWPDAGSEAAGRNLHVAIAALRRALEPAAARGRFQLLRRDGEAYLIDTPIGSVVDLLRFEHALRLGHLSRQRADLDGAAAAYREALDWYRGDLLPEDGPVEWISARRDAARLAAVEASQGLAEILLEMGDAEAAARACTAGLNIERFHDPLWRLLIQARDRAGDQGAANRARLGYERVLAELDIEAGVTGSPQP